MKQVLEIYVNDGVLFIKKINIVRLEADGSYTKLYLKGGIKHIASRNLKYFENQLDPESFFRCHNSHIVNLKEVTKLINNEGIFAILSDNSKADVGKKHKETFLKK